MDVYRRLKKKIIDLYGENESSAICFLLLEKHCGLGMTDVVTGKDERLDSVVVAELDKMAVRLAEGEPVQYVLGEATFHGRAFRVAPGVLIPRPETDELVGWICNDYMEMDRERSLNILDIGTGSGCIAVSLACELKNAGVEAWDISEDALRIARENALRLGVEVVFRKVDILAPLSGEEPLRKFDVVVSNPPYVCECERADMERNVLEYEPEQALFVPDDDPLLFYRKIAEKAGRLLRDEGALYFEINRRMGTETVGLLRSSGFENVEIMRDFMGNERMAKGLFRKKQEYGT